jgi:hypothetical protein
MKHSKLLKVLTLCAAAGVALIAVSSAFAWRVTLTAEPKFKRTHSWKIEKSASQSAITLKAGETANVTYTVTATPTGYVDSDFRVDGTAHLARDPNLDVDVNNVVVDIQLQDIIFDRDAIPASVACNPPFPVDITVSDVTCTYGAGLPDTTPRNVVMRATITGGGRVATQEFDFLNATMNEVDETVNLTDSLTGPLGSASAADGAKTFTYTKTIGPYTTSQCGNHTVDNTAAFTTTDSGATGSASASVAVTVTCPPPPKPKCALPSLVWKFIGLIASDHFKALLPITLGTPGGSKSVVVTTTSQGMSILFKEWISSNVVDLLSTELLAAKLNAAAGRDVSSIASTIAAADAFLATKNASSSLSTSEKTQVKAWTATLEAYNNKCIPTKPGHPGDPDCKKHWDKPDKDWHKWNWKKYDWDD